MISAARCAADGPALVFAMTFGTVNVVARASANAVCDPVPRAVAIAGISLRRVLPDSRLIVDSAPLV